MGHRWCSTCEYWYETSEYTVNDSGETVCREEGHGATHGFIIDAPWSKREFFGHIASWYPDRDAMLEQAREQGLVE